MFADDHEKDLNGLIEVVNQTNWLKAEKLRTIPSEGTKTRMDAINRWEKCLDLWLILPKGNISALLKLEKTINESIKRRQGWRAVLFFGHLGNSGMYWYFRLNYNNDPRYREEAIKLFIDKLKEIDG